MLIIVARDLIILVRRSYYYKLDLFLIIVPSHFLNKWLLLIYISLSLSDQVFYYVIVWIIFFFLTSFVEVGLTTSVGDKESMFLHIVSVMVKDYLTFTQKVFNKRVFRLYGWSQRGL